jgi:hypothetical protein
MDQRSGRAVTEVSVAVRFWRRVDATMAQGEALLRTCRQLLESSICQRPTFAQMRRRIDAILPRGEVIVRTTRLLGNLSSRKKTVAFLVSGVVGVALILFLLEISMRRELAKEANDAAIEAVRAPSASPQKMDFGDAFSIQRTGSISLQSADLSGVPRATSSSDDGQTLGQAFREPVPLPRPRKPR